MRHLLPLFLLLSCLLALLPGCEPKSELVQTSGQLAFRQDTVLFDTVFTTATTVTKRLWVYNNNGGAIRTDISLAGAQGQTYSLIIDGDAGPAKSNVLIRGNDSLLILVRARLGETSAEKPFLLTDQVDFRTNGSAQNVKLVAYGQNAYYHRADIITATTTWLSDKPHVIINSAFRQGTNVFDVGVYVNEGATLTIQPGTKIYCHAGATVQVNGTLSINQNTQLMPGDTAAATAKQVLFRGDRLEAFYHDVPGQWGGIFFTDKSRNNVLRYCEIRNASFGTSVLHTGPDPTPPDLRLENVVFRNISGSNPNYVGTGLPAGGVVGVRGNVTARNCLFTNCGEYAVLGYGGAFNLDFCTVANYTPSFRRTTAALTFSNALEDTNGMVQKFPLSVTLTNSIVWGSIPDELAFINNADYYPAPNGLVRITNCLLKTQEYKAEHDSTDKPGLGAPAYHNALNQPPGFRSTPENAARNYDYRPVKPSGSLALTLLQGTAVQPPPVDLRNLTRTSNPPVVGAYEPTRP